MEKINDYIRKNQLKLKSEGIKSKFICDSCDLIMDKAQVTLCGCRFCSHCIRPYLVGDRINCPKCSTSLDVENDVGSSLDLDFKIRKLIMKCPNTYCDTKLYGTSEMFNHINVCPNSATTKCVFNELGCGRVLKANSDLKLHLNEELEQHLVLIIKKLESINNDKTEKIEKLEKRLSEEQNRNASLEERLDKLEKVGMTQVPSGLNETENQCGITISTLSFSYDDEWWMESDTFSVRGYCFVIQFSFDKNDINFYVKLVKGDNDDHLLWPLQNEMELTLYDDEGDEYKQVSFCYSEEKSGKIRYNKPGQNQDGVLKGSLMNINKCQPILIAHNPIFLMLKMKP